MIYNLHNPLCFTSSHPVLNTGNSTAIVVTREGKQEQQQRHRCLSATLKKKNYQNFTPRLTLKEVESNLFPVLLNSPNWVRGGYLFASPKRPSNTTRWAPRFVIYGGVITLLRTLPTLPIGSMGRTVYQSMDSMG